MFNIALDKYYLFQNKYLPYVTYSMTEIKESQQYTFVQTYYDLQFSVGRMLIIIVKTHL